MEKEEEPETSRAGLNPRPADQSKVVEDKLFCHSRAFNSAFNRILVNLPF